jgi:hypothetical protein
MWWDGGYTIFNVSSILSAAVRSAFMWTLIISHNLVPAINNTDLENKEVI